MTRALVIGRRHKGRPIAALIRQTQDRLEAEGWAVDTALVDEKKQLRRTVTKAVKRGAEIVVAVGGDGVVLQVVQELADTAVALGIVPAGTGNLLAGNLEIPTDPEQAMSLLIGGRRRRIDLGRLEIDGKKLVFSVACGIGFDAEVMKATSKSQKLRWGKLAYFANTIRQSHRVRDEPHEIRIDGRQLTMGATQVFVANFGKMGAGLKPRLPIAADDGLLDVIIVQASGPLPGLLAGWEALRQGIRGKSDPGHVYRAHAREVEIATDPPRLVEIDGSVVGSTPVKVSIRPDALTVIVPEA